MSSLLLALDTENGLILRTVSVITIILACIFKKCWCYYCGVVDTGIWNW